MKNENKVLACVDQSRYAVHVADCAAWAARRIDAPLELLHVIDSHPERQRMTITAAQSVSTLKRVCWHICLQKMKHTPRARGSKAGCF